MTLQCCFVNTNQEPERIVRQGQFKYHIDYHKELHLSELCLVFYKHPEAPKSALIQLFQWIPVSFPVGSELLIKNAIDAVHAIQIITSIMPNYTLIPAEKDPPSGDNRHFSDDLSNLDTRTR